MELITPVSAPSVGSAPAVSAARPSATVPAAGPGVQPAFRGVRFGALARSTFIIPPGSLVVTVPGMFGPKASVEPLKEYLAGQGHEAHSVLVPGIGTAQLMRHSTDWLSSKIDNLRTQAAQRNLRALMRQMKGQDPQAQRDILRRHFGLDDSALATAVVDAVHHLLLDKDSRFVRNVQHLNPEAGFGHMLPKAHYERLSKVLSEAQVQLFDALSPAVHADGNAVARQELALVKIVNRVLDTLAPRVVLVGHSLGGVISAKTQMDDLDDVALSISLGSPLNGTEEVPPSLRMLEKLVLPPFRPAYRKALRGLLGVYFPAIEQMNARSRSVKKLQQQDMPPDTSAVSVANPLDGLVTETNARHNEALPGRLNITVTPREAQVEGLLEEWHQALLKLLSLNPFLRLGHGLAKETEAYKGLSHHCGLVQHHETYWPCDGDMLRQVFDDPAHAPERIRRLLHPQNNEAVRERVLALMADRLDDHPELAAVYQPLRPDLEALTGQPLPFRNSVAERAEALLARLQPAD